MTPKKVCSWSKIIIFEKWTQVTLLYEFDVDSKTCKILLYFVKWQICPLFVSRPNTYEWVSESLKCTKAAVNDIAGCIWMQTKNFTPKNYSELQRNVRMFFWEMTPGYPTWCRVGRVVLSRNDKLLLGEKSPSTYLGIIERGTDTIGFGRNSLWSSCLKWQLRGITFNLYL